MICPCERYDDEEEWGVCMCGHVLDEHKENGECTVEVD